MYEIYVRVLSEYEASRSENRANNKNDTKNVRTISKFRIRARCSRLIAFHGSVVKRDRVTICLGRHERIVFCDVLRCS